MRHNRQLAEAAAAAARRLRWLPCQMHGVIKALLFAYMRAAAGVRTLQ